MAADIIIPRYGPGQPTKQAHAIGCTLHRSDPFRSKTAQGSVAKSASSKTVGLQTREIVEDKGSVRKRIRRGRHTMRDAMVVMDLYMSRIRREDAVLYACCKGGARVRIGVTRGT